MSRRRYGLSAREQLANQRPTPAWQLLTSAEGDLADGSNWAWSPFRAEFERRVPIALAKGYLVVVDGKYQLTDLGRTYVKEHRPSC